MALVPALDLTTLFGFQVALWAQNNPNQPQRANGPQWMGPIGAIWAPMGPYVLPLSRRMVVDSGQVSTDAAGCLLASFNQATWPMFLCDTTHQHGVTDGITPARSQSNSIHAALCLRCMLPPIDERIHGLLAN